MILEYHNGHGSQLVLKLTKQETVDMINALSAALLKTNFTDVTHYVEFQTLFENDNDVYATTAFDVFVEGDPTTTENIGCKPAFPCGKPVEATGSIPAGPCDLSEDHAWGCLRRVSPVYEL